MKPIQTAGLQKPQLSLSDYAVDLNKDFSMATINHMKGLFRQCDKDRDGQLSKGELGAVLVELGIIHTPEELSAMFTQLDTNQSGSVTFDEFLQGLKFMEKSRRFHDRVGGIKRQNSVIQFVNSLEETQIKQMRELFSLIDTNHDGVVSKMELYNVMKDMGLDPSKEEVVALFAELDTDGDGKIGFAEFAGGMRWLKKGGLINGHVSPATPRVSAREDHDHDHHDPRQITNLQERNNILEKCLKDIVQRGMSAAEKHYRAKEYNEASLILNSLDMETLIDMEPFLGPIVSPKQKEHYEKMSRRLESGK